MPGRYVICPVVWQGNIRTPKVGTIADSGKPLETDPETGYVYSHFNYSAVVSDGVMVPPVLDGTVEGEALCLVAGINMSNLNSDQEIEKLVDIPDGLLPDLVTALDLSPDAALNTGQKNKFVNLFTDRAIDTSGITTADPFWQWGGLMAEHITGTFHDIRLLGTVVPE